MTARTYDVEKICRELADLGFHAEVDFGPGPSDISVAVLAGGGHVVIACDFNVDGWEAAWNPPEADQEPLHTWLDGDADERQVALWVAPLAYKPSNCLDSEACRDPQEDEEVAAHSDDTSRRTEQ